MGRSDSGSDAYGGGSDEERPEHLVAVDGYYLDKYEVTVGRFRRFVENYDGNKPLQGAGAHPRIAASGWQSAWDGRLPSDARTLVISMTARDEKCNELFRTWTDARGSNECLPINCIDWYLAFAFCIWDGGRLPTEAEWEFAAAGGPKNLLFPWGSDTPPDNAHAVFQCTASGTNTCSPGDIRPIGSAKPVGDGPFGHSDLAGSMLEVTRDVYDVDFYRQPESVGANVASLVGDIESADSPVRGGNYLGTGAELRAAFRMNVYRTSRWDGVGFRCARDP